MSRKHLIESILSQYLEGDKINLSFIVGVDGLGGAGKTTFVEKLKIDLENKGYNVLVLHLDDYIVETNKRYETGFEEWYEYYYLQWDIQLLQVELFEKLRAGQKMLQLPLYDRGKDTIFTKEVYLAPAQIVVVEGIFLQRREWRSYFDYVAFLDCPYHERKKRVLNRDLYIGDYNKRLKKYEERYWVAEEQYMNLENPLEKADVIYNSSNIYCSTNESRKK